MNQEHESEAAAKLTPKKGETHKEFKTRCWHNPGMAESFPDSSQRMAVCHSAWDKAKKKSKGSIQVGSDDELLIE